ncbi:MAG: NAD(P)/FAD-dependent oxidoreductase [Candidatus Omnitrophica bacterium]|nr:NAD(P)/FAD-dependent oxidoreductase [Candidatus Omnitrophota bacterium]
MEKYDVIVIGSGFGGLISAAFLSVEGYRVAVFEKENYAGGLCASFKNGGYTFDVAVDAVGAMREGEILRDILKKLDIESQLDIICLDPIRRNIFPDFTIDIAGTAAEYKETLSKLFSSEKEGIDNLFSLMRKIYKQSIAMIFSGENNDIRAYYDWLGKPFSALLDNYLTDKKLKAVLSSYCNYLGLPSSRVSSILVVNTLMHYLEGGAFRIGGGMQNLIKALVGVIEKNSGKVFWGRGVKKILTNAHRATGVITEKEEVFQAKHIISNIDLKTVTSTMFDIGEIEEEKAKKIKELEVSASFVIAYIGAKMDLNKHKVTNSMGYFSSYETMDMFNINKNISYGLSIPSLIDPVVSPEGCHTFIVYWPLSGGKEMGGKEKIADILTRSVDQIIPGFSRSVVLRRVANAKTFFRYTGNSDGAAYGWSQKAGFYTNLPFFRNIVDNFHIVGHWAGFGGGMLPVAISALKAVSEITNKKMAALRR